jgi:hypothetical protein
MVEAMSRSEASGAWHKKAAANLRLYLAELEAYLGRAPASKQRSATEQLIVEVKRRLTLLDETPAGER